MPKELPLRRILVALDFSESAGAALGRAVKLAQKTGATLFALHIVDDPSAQQGHANLHWQIPKDELARRERTLSEAAEEHLARILKPFRKTIKKLRMSIVPGIPFVEITRAAIQCRADLVVAGTQGLSGLKRMLVGSTAERLVRSCPCPVWIARHGHEWPLKSILVAVDLSEVSGKGLRLAATLARHLRCPITVLYVLNSPREDTGLLSDVDELKLNARQRRRLAQQRALEQLEEFIAMHVPPGIVVEPRLALGEPWHVIGVTAKNLDAGLVVLGSVGRTGIPGFFIGNTAEKVLRTCDRSLLTVKPDGFESPIKVEESSKS